MQTIHELIRLARKEAGVSQEAAAPRLYMSVNRLKRLESGTEEPCPADIGRMADIYHKPLLAEQYVGACAYAAGCQTVPDITIKALPQAAMHLINSVYNFADKHRDRQLLRIAEDGKIDVSEQTDFDAIMAELLEITRAATELRWAQMGGGDRVNDAT